MAWPGKGTLSAKEILGMEPEELKTKLDSSATKADVTAQNAKLEEHGTALSEIRAMLAKLTSPPPPEPDPNISADLNDPTTQVLTDPAGFINRQTSGIQNTALNARADVLEMRARSEYPGAFSKFGDTLMTAAKNFPVGARAQEGFWPSHIRMVMGDKLVKGELEGGSYPSLVGSSSFSPNSNTDTDPNRGFSPDMAKFFKDRNIPLDKAEKIKRMMADNGEPINMENYKGVVGNA